MEAKFIVINIISVFMFGGLFMILYLYPAFMFYKSLIKKEKMLDLTWKANLARFLSIAYTVIFNLYLLFLIAKYWGRFFELGMWGVVFALPFQILFLVIILVLFEKSEKATSNKVK